MIEPTSISRTLFEGRTVAHARCYGVSGELMYCHDNDFGVLTDEGVIEYYRCADGALSRFEPRRFAGEAAFMQGTAPVWFDCRERDGELFINNRCGRLEDEENENPRRERVGG